ncbi:MAG: hypothetical protein WAV11_03485 [Minisyncoccia bacterium]
MNEQKQIAKLHAIVLENLPEMTSELRQGLIVNPKRVKIFLSGITDVALEKIVIVTHKFNDRIDYNRFFDDFVKAGMYTGVSEDMIDKNFPSVETGKGEIEYVLFHFNRSISEDEVIEKMALSGCVRPTMKEFLNFGEKHPEIQKEFTIIASGIVFRDCSRKNCFISHRFLGMSKINGGRWNGDCRFLAVKISK